MGQKNISVVDQPFLELIELGYSLDKVMSEYIRAVLIHYHGNKMRAARLLRVNLSTIKRKIYQNDWNYLKGNCDIDTMISRGVVSMEDYLKRKNKL